MKDHTLSYFCLCELRIPYIPHDSFWGICDLINPTLQAFINFCMGFLLPLPQQCNYGSEIWNGSKSEYVETQREKKNRELERVIRIKEWLWNIKKWMWMEAKLNEKENVLCKLMFWHTFPIRHLNDKNKKGETAFKLHFGKTKYMYQIHKCAFYM